MDLGETANVSPFVRENMAVTCLMNSMYFSNTEGREEAPRHQVAPLGYWDCYPALTR